MVDLITQVGGTLPPYRGGTGNAFGWAYGLIVPEYNNSGATWPQGTALTLINGSPRPTTTAHAGPFLGVVVGTIALPSGVITPGDAANETIAAVQVTGIVPMILDSGDIYGWFVSCGGGAGDGHVIGYAGQTATSVGIVRTTEPGQVLVQLLAGSGNVSSTGFLSEVVLQAGNLSGVVTAGLGSMVPVPWPCELVSAELFGDQTGDAVVDIYAGESALWPPSTSICAATLPTLAAQAYYLDTSLVGWTTTFDARTSFRLYVVSAATVEQLTVALTLRQTG